jgi:ABC-type Na+ efflux pump permease subunit
MNEPAERDAVRVFAGRALVTVGALILGLSGLCTLYFGGLSLFSDLKQANSYGSFSSILPFMLVLGGVPMLIGFGLFRWGLSVLRKRPKPPPSAPPPG